MQKSWTVVIDTELHIVNLKSAFSGRGEISVDGKVVATWRLSLVLCRQRLILR